MKVAIIPARGGSKRIPRKNIKPFCGKPMIAWSIEQAKASECFDRIIVSTDDLEIADIACQYGAEIPFMRPDELSNDHATTGQVMNHAVTWLQHESIIQAACCIYATAPFLSAEDIRFGYRRLEETQSDYTFSVTTYAFPIQRALKKSVDDYISMFQPEAFQTRSQDLEEAFHDAGQFYWGTSLAWKEEKPVFNSNSTGIILPRHRVQDIDTQEDWLRAELMFQILQQSYHRG
ncbi:pseudaminic acid cytidylyltransferase [Pectobacterium parmentieri]|uniref:Acylneuraminate cytidylyltransferase n=1 Tax=Pectobacterium parmentieri TaxID=1905730 RepID=A0A0H3I793_PECPM|nr:pseudaminic acid cytidylyltransferase [Pectobacterium parmentieri]ACX88775.1 pseudaminic acid CMP-transferase [Pectobacterium parmentieri WPP163]AFI91101.1 Acylneuraminate cytidylyltransferase [Pectobacterium parmentieri]AYH32761.1 pseudaminic acid cytidylyltransferase [Pectobacterium parmentieri]MCL6355537.1 pseudaminic acid cytidylyltransferase [Pectobacterium parmentieri]MCL6380562.1 pseudaminic acid cytidylyltransferase [Pectobacterium parmentieri]